MSGNRRYEAHPQSSPGDFYVVDHECASCGAPHEVASDLIGWSNPEIGHCIWKKQPETAQEMQQALAAFDACCLGCYRYAGSDPNIIAKVGVAHCDNASLPELLKAKVRRLVGGT
ncbi:MAG: hypothetical protein ACK6D7_23070 [Acidobacteriota bacterium]